MRSSKTLVYWLLSLLLLGCAYPISEQIKDEVAEDATFPMVLKNPSAYEGDIVLWGGVIIETVNLKEGAEIFVLDTPLDHWEEPEPQRYSRGKFIAKTTKFLDPAVYGPGKKITLAGKIVGGKTMPLGETKYTYPVVLIKQFHLWQQVYDYPYHYPGNTPFSSWGSPYNDPFYGSYYGPFYGPIY